MWRVGGKMENERAEPNEGELFIGLFGTNHQLTKWICS